MYWSRKELVDEDQPQQMVLHFDGVGTQEGSWESGRPRCVETRQRHELMHLGSGLEFGLVVDDAEEQDWALGMTAAAGPAASCRFVCRDVVGS